jgi:hypothetical protein
MERHIEEDSPSENPTDDGKPNHAYWRSQIDAAKEAQKETSEANQAAWDEYTRKSRKGGNKLRKNNADFCPTFWSSIRTIQPAYYSRTPKLIAEKADDSLNDTIANYACLNLERLAKYLIRAQKSFDGTQAIARDTYLLGGKATTRVICETIITDEPVKIRYAEHQIPDPATQQPTVVYLDSHGQPAPEGVELFRDEEGVYAESLEEKLEKIKVNLIPVRYDDVLHTPNARDHDEVDWMSYGGSFTKPQVDKLFGKKVAEAIPYSEHGKDEDTKKKKHRENKTVPTKYARIWEIWDKTSGELYWLAEGHTELIRAEGYQGGDPYELDGFFPSPPFILGTCGQDDMYPTPDFIQLEPLINQIHALYSRLKSLIRALKRKGMYDASFSELAKLGNITDETEFLAIVNFQKLVNDKGGLEALVSWFPVKEVAAAVQELAQALQLYEQKFNELAGIPDLLRGTSDPNETAAAQQLKGKFLSLRFSANQRDFQSLVRDGIELMCDLALKKFSDEKLAEICGVKYQEAQEQEMFPECLILLRNDEERKIRIDIETDSTITMNENAEIEQANYLAKTVFEGIAAVGQARQQAPEVLPVAAQTFKYAISKLRDGKQIESALKASIEAMMQPPPPPDPSQDPALIKAQAQMQLDKQKAEQQMQLQAMKTQQEMILAEQKFRAEMYFEERKMASKERLETLDAQHQQQQAALEAELMVVKEQIKGQIEREKHEQKLEESAMLASAKTEATKAKSNGNGKGGDVHLHL